MTNQQTTSTDNSAVNLLNDIILLDLLTDTEQAGLLSNTLASQTTIKPD